SRPTATVCDGTGKAATPSPTYGVTTTTPSPRTMTATPLSSLTSTGRRHVFTREHDAVHLPGGNRADEVGQRPLVEHRPPLDFRTRPALVDHGDAAGVDLCRFSVVTTP